MAFVVNGAMLPRRSGHLDIPLSEQEGALPFQSPPNMSVEFTLPHRGKIVGMGIPVGVVLIVGGGFHGKSTLLRALEVGVIMCCNLLIQTLSMHTLCHTLSTPSQPILSPHPSINPPHNHPIHPPLILHPSSSHLPLNPPLTPPPTPSSHPQPSLSNQVGVYDHIPGDGREFVVCDSSAVKIRSEDGR